MYSNGYKYILFYQSILPEGYPDKIIYSEAAGEAAIYVYCPKHIISM
jgi:hypothetical protein